ncbi:MAG: hypothetical protein A4S09_03145 [Proteobacteria bacterium SG_bin7]|nr:MAG: hypothetical protein A4S09_03145 [Proteobacteria bacterium SG_bin7]
MVLITGIFGGTVAAQKIYQEVRLAALIKAAKGLPKLSPLAHAMTRQKSDLDPSVLRSKLHRSF